METGARTTALARARLMSGRPESESEFKSEPETSEAASEGKKESESEEESAESGELWLDIHGNFEEVRAAEVDAKPEARPRRMGDAGSGVVIIDETRGRDEVGAAGDDVEIEGDARRACRRRSMKGVPWTRVGDEKSNAWASEASISISEA